MADRHPRLWLAYVLLAVTAQTGLYRFYLRTSGAGTVMLIGFLMIPVLALAAGKVGLYLGLAIAVALTCIVVVDLFKIPALVHAAHSREDAK